MGALSLLGVLCFHFPEALTSPDLRSTYSIQFARTLLATGLVGAFVLGTTAALLRQSPRIALTGVATASLALALGGAGIPVDQVKDTPYALGLDWFILALFFSALVFVPLERYLAPRQHPVLRPGWRTDVTYFFVGHVLVQFVLIAVTVSASTLAAPLSLPGVKQAVSSMPGWAQFVVAVFVADLAQAVLHRAYHRISALWRFHSVHHSSRDLDWLAGSRIHFVETVLTRSIVLFPLLVAGFSVGVVNAYVILVGLQAVVAHANIGVRFGPLEYVLVLPRYHHWHHARHVDYWDRNYAIHLPLVDMLLGSFKLPRDGSWPAEYGVLKLESVPRGFVAQHAMPFRAKQTYVDHVA